MQSVMKHQFSKVPTADIQRSSFDRTHGYKTTFDAGYLVPFYVDECLPGDTFNLNATLFSRLTTPQVAFMDNLVQDTHYFAVPLRLVWDNFQKFMGEQTDPDDSTDYLIPTVTVTPTIQSLWDYFGIPYGVEMDVNALFSRAYNLIYKEWFRDQNLQDSPVVDTDDGPDNPADYVLRKRGKRHDYFTSALPWPQKGPGVELPLGTSAPVIGDGGAMGITDGNSGYAALWMNYNATNQLGLNEDEYGGSLPTLDTAVTTLPVGYSLGLTEEGDASGVIADLSEATAATINTIRQAFQLQKMLERDARGGTRYTEIVRSHFGTVSPDARLQRPEYLGGSTVRVGVTPLPQTAPDSGDTTPLGTVGGFGTATDTGNGFTKSFTEHCIVIGLVSVRADLTYQQGLPRMFSRSTRYDFYWPALAHLGEQAVLNKEIYAQGTSADDDVFGYQERWAEYRYYPSKITGQLRSTYETPLDYWHLSQEFTSLPTLSSTFIEENPPVDRVIAVTSYPQFVMDSHIQIKCARPMPVYSVPGLIDHF